MGITILKSSAALSDTTPDDVGLAVATAGTGELASRFDHAHDIEDTDWQTPTLLNSWVVYDATFGDAAMYRRVGGIVHLRGLVKSGSASTVIFNLPGGFRPLIRLLFACYCSTGVCRMDVTTSGDVIAGSDSSSAWTALNNIRFPAGG